MRALVTYNNYSGKSKITKKIGYICQSLKTKYDIVECFKTRGPKSITEYITSCGNNYDLIVVVGGDGSVNEAINGIMKVEHKPVLAFIPMGTCNDAARTLGLSRNLKKTMNIILENKIVKMDISKINDKYFTYGMAAGCITEISYETNQQLKKRIGRFAYYLAGLKAYKDSSTISINLTSDKENFIGDLSLFLACNTRYLGGFKIRRRRRIYLNEGKLRLTMIVKTSKMMNFFDFGMFLLFGENYTHNIINFDVTKMRIRSDKPIAYNTDGEGFGKQNDINVEVLPSALRLIVNKRIRTRHFLRK